MSKGTGASTLESVNSEETIFVQHDSSRQKALNKSMSCISIMNTVITQSSAMCGMKHMHVSSACYVSQRGVIWLVWRCSGGSQRVCGDEGVGLVRRCGLLGVV